MTKVLSVIVPSYNASNFLKEDIPFFLDDRVVDDIEIIIVNDGSKDDTLKTAQKFCSEYPETIICIDKENGGHGSTINAGVGIARGKYFKVVSFEVWGNEDNSNLLNQVATTMKQEAGGVPYIVIGDKVFAGYAEDYDDDIKTAIKKLYDTDKADRYDVMEHLSDSTAAPDTTGTNTSKDSSSNFSLIIFYIVFTLAACTVVVVYENKKRIELENRILILEGKKIRKDEE